MGRQGQGREQGASHSSIALLQERFRQLQRMKEMREEREHRRVLTTDHEQQRRWLFYHPELLQPSRSLRGLSKHPIRSFHYTSGQLAEGLASDPSFSMGVLQQTCTPANFPEDKDVDTSLHL